MVMHSTDVDVMLLVGGRGTRLKGIVSDVPKPMAPVAGRPFVEWLLLMLRSQGIHRVILCTGYMRKVVEEHFRDGERIGMEIAYSPESVPLGTAGAIRNALSKATSERLLVINGDSYCRLNLTRFLQEHLLSAARASLWVIPVSDCSRYGSVEIDQTHAVLAFREKTREKQSGLINAGIYLCEREVMEGIPGGRAVSLETEVFPGLVGQGLYAVKGDGNFIDIGIPESYREAESFIQGELTWLEKQK